MDNLAWIKTGLFLLALIGWFVWVARRSWLLKEYQRNDAQQPPSENQQRWDLRHIREDVSVLVLVNSILLWFVAYSIVFRFH